MRGFGRSRARIERLLALSWILQTRRPVPLSELREHYGLYVDGDEDSTRRRFERDKEDLRSLGFEIETVTVDDVPGYRAARSTSPLRTVNWTEEELDTLATLAAAVGDAATGTALARLAAPSGQFPAERASAQVEVDIDIPAPIAEALRTGRSLTFRYRRADGTEAERRVDPWAPRMRNGLRYLTGYDLDADDERNFRVDRIVGEPAVTDQAIAHPRPEGDLNPLYPEEQVAVVANVPIERRREAEAIDGEVLDVLPPSTDAVEPHAEGGWLRVLFESRRPEEMLGWALRHGARVREPAELVDEAEARLRRLHERHVGHPTPVEVPRTARARSTNLTSERLSRMLALPGWLGERAGVTREEAAMAFGCTVEEITEELELLELIDIPGVGSVVEVEEHSDGQLVYHRFRQEPTVSLSPTDALRLLVLVDAGSVVLSREEAPALSSIERRLRDIVPATVDLELQGRDHPDLESLRAAIDDGRVVQFDYRGRKDSAWRQRHVAPIRTAVANGAIYLTGYDLDASAERHFRLDRLSDVEIGEPQPAIAAEAAAPSYVPSADDTRVVLLLSTRATWILTHVNPSASASRDDGGVVAVVETDAVDWLVSHVLAAGGEAEVIGPVDVRRRVVARASHILDTADGAGTDSTPPRT